jgi:hypothetical protein
MTGKQTEKTKENKSKSRFSGVLNRVTPISDEVTEAEPVATAPSPNPVVTPAPTATTAKMGRPPGKKTNPEYTQVTVYLRKDVHRQAKKLLIDDGREFSELVDELVNTWVEGH